jgi:hypothetical protein
MITRDKAKQIIESKGGVLYDNDMVKCWEHEDDTPSAKLYDLHRIRCFVCNKTFFLDSKENKKRIKTITRAEYQLYRISTGQTNKWPRLKDDEDWINKHKDEEHEATQEN